MNKLIKIVLIIVVLVIAVILGLYSYSFINKKIEITSFSGSYQDLAQECLESYSYNYDCCISSVHSMAKGNYKLLEGNVCPSGYRINGLLCGDAYRWCEPLPVVKKSPEFNSEVSDCVIDSDCELVYSNLEEPCSACDFSDNNWVCLSKEMAKQEQDKRAQKYKGVLCERCPEEESNVDKFECQCNRGACVKDKKY